MVLKLVACHWERVKNWYYGWVYASRFVYSLKLYISVSFREATNNSYRLVQRCYSLEYLSIHMLQRTIGASSNAWFLFLPLIQVVVQANEWNATVHFHLQIDSFLFYTSQENSGLIYPVSIVSSDTSRGSLSTWFIHSFPIDLEKCNRSFFACKLIASSSTRVKKMVVWFTQFRFFRF